MTTFVGRSRLTSVQTDEVGKIFPVDSVGSVGKSHRPDGPGERTLKLGPRTRIIDEVGP